MNGLTTGELHELIKIMEKIEDDTVKRYNRCVSECLIKMETFSNSSVTLRVEWNNATIYTEDIEVIQRERLIK